MGPNLIMRRVGAPWLFATLAVGALLGGLLVGYEPVGGDPDRLYRPLKTELARALREGRLPFWSDRIGLGVPLVAESHVAAFYPINPLLYRLFSVSRSYRWSMWLHYLALVAATYAYGRRLGLTPWGGALTALSFSLSGFQAIHATHEPFYHLMPYLPLALLLAEVYVASGRQVWLAVLALALGAQWTLGHFQIQMWTNGLVITTGLWRASTARLPWRRVAGLAGAVLWGIAIAAVQLALSWDLARTVGNTARPLHVMAFYSYPPAHWIELVLPWLFRGLRYGAEDPYFLTQHTTGFEAMFYVGTVPLILAFVGALGVLAPGRGRSTGFWLLVIPVSFALATMPRWWLDGYAAMLQWPGLGYFRAPARYTLLTSLGLAMLAGQGIDRLVPGRRFNAGLALAVAFGLAAIWSGFVLSSHRGFRSVPGPVGLPFGVATAGLTWAVALMSLAFWRVGKVGAWLPAMVTAVELGALYYLGPTLWGWAVPLPERSPVLSAIAADPSVGRVGGVIDNLPVSAGMTTGTPYLGMTLSPINQLLHSLQEWGSRHGPAASLWQRRLGVTHSVWDEPVWFGSGEAESKPMFDPALDLLAYRPVGKPEKRLWRIVRHPDPFPAARVVLHERVVPDWPTLFGSLTNDEARNEAWFYPGDLPPRREKTLLATSARLVDWDGRTGVIEHDGVCYLILMRAFDRGWMARVGDGPEVPVLRVDGGLQAIRVEGSGKTRVSVRFEPSALRASASVSVVAAIAALAVVAVSLPRRWIKRHLATS